MVEEFGGCVRIGMKFGVLYYYYTKLKRTRELCIYIVLIYFAGLKIDKFELNIGLFD